MQTRTIPGRYLTTRYSGLWGGPLELDVDAVGGEVVLTCRATDVDLAQAFDPAAAGRLVDALQEAVREASLSAELAEASAV